MENCHKHVRKLFLEKGNSNKIYFPQGFKVIYLINFVFFREKLPRKLIIRPQKMETYHRSLRKLLLNKRNPK